MTTLAIIAAVICALVAVGLAIWLIPGWQVDRWRRAMGGRIAVMRRGELQQFGSPQELYDHPVNLFVASFLGSPSMNLLKAQIVAPNGRLAARIGDCEFDLPESFVQDAPALRAYEGRDVALGFRPEHIRPKGGAAAQLRGSVLVVESLGSELLAHIEIRAEQVLSDAVLEGSTVEEDEHETLLSLEAEHMATVIGRFDPETRVGVGEAIELAVNPAKLHLFDLETGLAIVG